MKQGKLFLASIKINSVIPSHCKNVPKVGYIWCKQHLQLEFSYLQYVRACVIYLFINKDHEVPDRYSYFISTMTMEIIFDFNRDSNIQDWRIVDDIVMGGKSASSFTLSPDGFGLFEGQISLENNGGFSSVSYRFKKIKVNKDGNIIIKLKGDGKNYQVRIKDDSGHSYSYISPFTTSGAWQEIKIPLKDMYPSFRGRKLDLPNFSHNSTEELVFLIGNKKPEKFALLIDKIALD